MRGDPRPNTQAQAEQRQGVVFAVLTALLFSCSDALIKQLLLVAPFILVVWLRYLFQLGVLVAWRVTHRSPLLLRLGPWHLQVLRCLALALCTLSGYLALRSVSLAEYTALMMLVPVVSVVLGRVVLKERVSLRQWACVVLGLVGMVAVVRPGMAGWTPQSWLAVFSASCYAAFQMTSRKVMLVSDVVTANLVSAAFIFCVCGLALLIWPMDWGQALSQLEPSWWLVLFLMCTIATSGQFSLATALQKASLSVVAPFAYLQILFAVVIGVVFFGHWPDLATLSGSLLIAIAGIGSAWLNSQAPPVPGLATDWAQAHAPRGSFTEKP